LCPFHCAPDRGCVSPLKTQVSLCTLSVGSHDSCRGSHDSRRDHKIVLRDHMTVTQSVHLYLNPRKVLSTWPVMHLHGFAMWGRRRGSSKLHTRLNFTDQSDGTEMILLILFMILVSVSRTHISWISLVRVSRRLDLSKTSPAWMPPRILNSSSTSWHSTGSQ